MSNAAPNFSLISELQMLARRDFPLADTTLLQPLNANPLVDGEFLELNANYQLQRGGAGEGVWANVFPLFTERGRYDTQAIGKATVLMLQQYEAETAVFDPTSLSVGDPLCVNDVTFQALTRRGLKKADTASGRVVVGYVSRLISGSGKVRFVHYGNVKY